MIAARSTRVSYGFDAPYVLIGLGAVALGYLIALILVGIYGTAIAFWVVAIITIAMIAQIGLFLYATRRGKFQVWSELLDRLALRGDERVLDLGPGRGAVLLAVARRLSTGRVVGIDLWRTIDQSGNSAEIAERNADACGVADRVELCTGDMTALPFPDNEFDVVVSSLAIHNIKSATGRAAAVREALRVLRPGGRMVIADISKAPEYREVLSANGARDVTIEPLGWRMWFAGPWMSTNAVMATKPA
ncbi:class I SAM-dependent methyltransferase [Nocardia arthritidis]|uniref:Methyltransferase domain-containing protein n=1 Tax=Nocardia arthritidis TaxID=228602 RepID=A0A6G9YNF2_9NOCA|nr:class I SAM-dependent methyltransferase [Nocardia arthritidis]QIS14607.1 methyltransferase domain-containing protein [Nocardia arthritidis]